VIAEVGFWFLVVWGYEGTPAGVAARGPFPTLERCRVERAITWVPTGATSECFLLEGPPSVPVNPGWGYGTP
jgi:hypothetical protein